MHGNVYNSVFNTTFLRLSNSHTKYTLQKRWRLFILFKIILCTCFVHGKVCICVDVYEILRVYRCLRQHDNVIKAKWRYQSFFKVLLWKMISQKLINFIKLLLRTLLSVSKWLLILSSMDDNYCRSLAVKFIAGFNVTGWIKPKF